MERTNFTNNKKISRSVGIICKLRHCMDVSLLRTIYYSLVYSHLNYGIQVWGSACKTDLDKILILQKKTVRAMTGHRWYQTYGKHGPSWAPSDPLFKSLGILKIYDVYKLSVGKFIYSSLSHLSPPLFWSWFSINNEKATRSNTIISQINFFDVGTTKQTLTLHRKPYKKDTYGAKMIQVLGPVLWNEFPENVRDADSKGIFKKNLIKFLLGNYES